jgi:hypothetical protein
MISLQTKLPRLNRSVLVWSLIGGWTNDRSGSFISAKRQRAERRQLGEMMISGDHARSHMYILWMNRGSRVVRSRSAAQWDICAFYDICRIMQMHV